MKTLLTILLSILTLTGFSQSIEGMVTSTGTTFTSSGITLDFASGHPILMNGDNDNILFDNVVATGSVGIVEHDEVMSLTFYPNPTTDFIQTNESNIDMLSVYNLNGALVKQVNKSSIIDVNDLSPGAYILVAQSNNQVSTFKFIKK